MPFTTFDHSVLADAAPFEDAWNQIRAGLRRDLGARLFDQWLKPVRIGNYCSFSQSIELWTASDFSASFVTGQFGDRLRLAWRTADIGVREVRVVRAPDDAAPRALRLAASGPEDHALTEPAVAPVPASALAREGLHLRHDFASFVVGAGNRLAFSAAQAMAAPTAPLFNPLYIHGSTGQGKTHLLHAIATEYLNHHPQATVLYMSAEKFMMEFVTAMRANESMAFKARLRAARLLLIDDIQFIAGKGSTQEEFLHTINELATSGARIVISADRAPHHMDGVDPRILSRLAGGLVADIQPADLDLRLAILQARRAAMSDVAIPDSVIDFLARAIRSNVRELEGAFNKVLAYAQLTGRAIDMEFAQAMLADSVRANARRITVDDIQKACAAHYRIEPSEMRSKRRARAVARPRQVAMYLAKKMTPRSLPEIGRIFGGRDHSTVIHAVRTIEGLRQTNPDIDADIRALQRQLEG
ncbi:chromosomal replication initiator protein DnaA [Sphingobium subterraneum]|uniref:Chromosomal replication initiator protein DnaA n=1 Tax=Sphingobium subterraneum TaxID=627688 RepID=A0A841J833_9SPHN|nr:chromosomal replication initiator protein DnaA [Sphingobium subterraneum]MBB6124331.1 chromosomal replication initiator protein [Sphingobium subterraneum]